MDKTQNQSQSQISQPIQISQEQLQQFHFNFLGQNGQATAIQVKQEFPTQQTAMSDHLKQQIAEQQQQMQLIEAAAASPQQHHTPNSQAMSMPQTQQNTTSMTTMSPLQLQGGQVQTDWGQRVQVVQQPYLQQYLPPVIMPNLIHPGLSNPSIQVIAAGKPFQSNQITPQMLAQGKSVIGNGAGGFSGTYTLPTSQSQTLLFSPVNVLSSQPQQQQQSLMPMTATNTTPNQNGVAKQATQQELSKTFTSNGQKVLQKVATTTVNAASNAGAVAQQQQQVRSMRQCFPIQHKCVLTLSNII